MATGTREAHGSDLGFRGYGAEQGTVENTPRGPRAGRAPLHRQKGIDRRIALSSFAPSQHRRLPTHVTAFCRSSAVESDLATDHERGDITRSAAPLRSWVEEKLAFLKTELKITDAQIVLWDGFAETARDLVKAAARRGAHPGTGASMIGPLMLPVRLAMRERRLAEELEALREWRPLIEPFYVGLSEAQKASADQWILRLFAMWGPP